LISNKPFLLKCVGALQRKEIIPPLSSEIFGAVITFLENPKPFQRGSQLAPIESGWHAY
jgi:hypothetical protein